LAILKDSVSPSHPFKETVEVAETVKAEEVAET